MKKKKSLAARIFLSLLCLFVWLPVILLITTAFMPEDELQYRYLSPLGLGAAPVRAALFPDYPTLKPLKELLLESPGFFVMFWNSCFQVFPVLLGQLVIGMPAAWAFARFEFKGKNILFPLYLILMIMPFQVTMVSNYLVLSRLNLLDTHLSIILPAVFSAFPVYIMTKCFETIPSSLIEAAYLDGAGELMIFLRVGIPLGIPGIVTSMLLSFFECWSALEQPLTFLKDPSLWPLSLYLPEITADKAAVAFAASMIMMTPSILLYLNGQEYLEQGIAASGVKE